jgi:peptide/nickel transport system ATP-binding protein
MSVVRDGQSVVIQVEDLRVHYPIRAGLFQRTVEKVRAVDGVTLSIFAGETLGLVGESGCGKTSLGQALVRMIKPSSGRILFAAEGRQVDLAGLSEAQLQPYRADIRMIFQDPYASLNPRRRVIDLVGESLRNFGTRTEADVEAIVADMLNKVGLRPEYIKRYPYAFSGGERQRIGIARALAVHPKLVIADECVSALDVSVQAQTLNLLQDLQDELDLTYLFISHDLSVVEYIADRVAVMYAGRVVELASTESLFARPRHPYTAALLDAVPRPDPKVARKATHIRLQGEVANPANRPTGCAFHPRCPHAVDICRTEDPMLQDFDGHQVACHLASSLDLKGVSVDAA